MGSGGNCLVYPEETVPRTQHAALTRLARVTIQAESDAALVARFVEGTDHTAFAELVRRYERLVWGQCRHVLANEADADDAFQTTFLVLARSARSIRAAARLGPWLHAVAHRVCLKIRRAGARRKRREQTAATAEGARPVADSVWDRAAAALHEEVHRLPDALRVPFVLCCLEGLEPTVAAKHLGLKWGTFSARLSRAKQSLIDRLARRGFGAGAVAGTIGFGPAAPAAVADRAVLLGTGGAPVPALVHSLCSGATGMARLKSKLFVVLGLALAALGPVALVFPAGSGDGAAPAEVRAAPAPPPDKAAKEQELERLWADLAKEEPACSSAVLKLFLQPEHAVPFLRDRLQPLKLDEKRCKELLKALGSDNEKTWKAAWNEFDYLDPRLAIGLQTLMNDVTEKPARTRLVELCSDRQADSMAGEDIDLRAIGMGDEGFNFSSNGSGAWWAEHKIERIGGLGNPKKTWIRAMRGVAVLEHLGTPAAVTVLEQLARGHAEAAPTKAAKASLDRLKKR